jgi:hypothetical protein
MPAQLTFEPEGLADTVLRLPAGPRLASAPEDGSDSVEGPNAALQHL